MKSREKTAAALKREQRERHCNTAHGFPLKFSYYTQRIFFTGKKRFMLLLSPLPQCRKTHQDPKSTDKPHLQSTCMCLLQTHPKNPCANPALPCLQTKLLFEHKKNNKMKLSAPVKSQKLEILV